MVVYETLGGKFDDPQEVSTNPVGKATLRFFDCGHGEMSFEIESWDLQGSFALQRVIPDSDKACDQISGITAQAVDINAGMDGAWYDQDTVGQGFFLDAHPDSQGGNFLFLSWFTFGEGTESGQRWLTAQGNFAGSTATLEIHETSGGSFNVGGGTETVAAGTMTIDFADCSHANLSYALLSEGAAGEIDLTRVVPRGESWCEGLTPAR